jgi:hypothetical protein
MKNEKGYVTFLSLLVVSAISSIVLLSLITTSTMRIDTTRVFGDGVRARSLAHGCVELGLKKIRSNGSFLGTENASFGNGSCEYTITADEIQALGISAGNEVRIKVEVTKNPFNIQSWKEVKSF